MRRKRKQKPNKFQFPSNGKAYLNQRLKRESVGRVSIPFRESVCTDTVGFQFPSNGKAYLNLLTTLQTGKRIQSDRFGGWVVSIPFKRESISELSETKAVGIINSTRFNSLANGKAYPKVVVPRARFNSLQTGVQRISHENLPIPFKREMRQLFLAIFQFQFPSNGKAYLNRSQIY